MAAIVELTDPEWALVKDLFDPPGRPGVAARYPRRQMVEAILFLARTGIQWRYLPVSLPALGGRLAAVAALARERGLGPRDVPDRPPDPLDEASARRADDGDD